MNQFSYSIDPKWLLICMQALSFMSSSTPVLAQDILIGEFSTRFVFRTPDTRDRAHNIILASNKIDGVTLKPGEIFSYNGTVGQRTESNGFREAHAIVNKVMVDEIGGGICQVSGTLHAAAYYAGLEMIERHSHSRASTYIAPGLDATVDWGSLDLKIRNPFPFPVTFRTLISETPTSWGGKLKVLTVQVLGEKKYPVEVNLVTRKSKRFYKTTVVRNDLPKGYRFVFQPGTKSYIIERTRVVTHPDNSKVLDHSIIKYSKSDRIVIIGTKEPEA